MEYLKKAARLVTGPAPARRSSKFQDGDMTGKQIDPTRDDLLSLARRAFDAGCVGAAVVTLKSIDDPTQAGTAFNNLSRNLYQARKDITNMIAVAEAGVAFCLDRAARAQSADTAKKLKETAKVIAYNAAVNCWPGWGDEGVEIAPAHIQPKNRSCAEKRPRGF
jgi:hypothetical protein